MNQRKNATLLIVLLILASTLTQIIRIGVVEANFYVPPPPTQNAYITNDGDIKPSTLPIDRIGNLYLLKGDVFNYTLEIQCSNIVVDGLGFELKGVDAYYGITFSGKSNITIRNMVINSFGSGIYVSESNNIVIEQNRIINCIGNCIYFLGDCRNCRVYKNTLITNNYGVSGQISFTEISSNEFLGGISMLTLSSSHSNFIKNNSFENQTFLSIELGFVSECNNNKIENNTFSYVYCSICLDEKSANNVLLSNKMSLGKYGVILGRAYENEFRENSIIGNEIGISIDFDAWKIYEIFDEQPYYNNCFCNNIISNLQNVYSRTASSYYNRWESNYWSDYNGTDTNCDSIGDTPYVIDEYNQDNHPLMKPTISSSPEPHQEPSPTTSVIGAAIVVAVVSLGLLVYYKRKHKCSLISTPYSSSAKN